ncbi:MAG: hypothetical protein AAFX76_02985 [Planctomycetota bacterium]
MGRLPVAHQHHQRAVEFAAVGQERHEPGDLAVRVGESGEVRRTFREDVLRPCGPRKVFSDGDPAGRPGFLQHDPREADVAFTLERLDIEIDEVGVGRLALRQHVIEARIEGAVRTAPGRVERDAVTREAVLEVGGAFFEEDRAGQRGDVRERRGVPLSVRRDRRMDRVGHHADLGVGPFVTHHPHRRGVGPVDRVGVQAVEIHQDHPLGCRRHGRDAAKDRR